MDKWKVTSVEEAKKLLPFLKLKYKEKYTLKQIRFAIEHNRCSLDGNIERFASKNLRVGQIVEIDLLPHVGFEFEPNRLLFEDSHFIAYNKPPFIPSTWGLDKVLASHFGSLFPVHRLDRDTTGIILFAKSKECQSRFESLFRERLIKKTYHALVIGTPVEPQGIIEISLAAKKWIPGRTLYGATGRSGQHSKTFWRCEKKGRHFSLLSCTPITGRTHQIRIHLNHIGHPILGDFDYGSRKLPPFLKPLRTMLHASELVFAHPFVKEKIALLCPLPQDFQKVLNSLK